MQATKEENSKVMNIVTPAEMTEIDRLTIEDFGLNSLVLMENAARSCLQFIPEGKIGILVGPGNNGGDGLVIARALSERGSEVECLLLSRKLSRDAETQLNLANSWGIPTYNLKQVSPAEFLTGKSVIIDSLFGTGLSRALEGTYREVVELANNSDSTRIAIDIPSGVDGANGQILGTAIKADTTVTFGCLKPGQLLYPGRELCGQLELTQPGFHPQALAHFDSVQLFDQEWARRYLPSLWPTAHKGDNGRLLLVTGSKTYPGAGILSVLGALRAGAGLVSQSTPESIIPALLSAAPEAMPIARPEAPDLGNFNALVVGSGLGPEASSIGLEVLRRTKIPTVVDADCLDLVSSISPEQREQFVLTPHPGELSRILGKPTSELETNRIESALAAAKEFGCVVLSKGAPTITAGPEGRAYVNSTGNPTLAQGGTGDLLAGIVGAYLAYGLPTLEAAACGAYIHGLAADLMLEKMGGRGRTASQIADLVPIAYQQAVGNPSTFTVF